MNAQHGETEWIISQHGAISKSDIAQHSEMHIPVLHNMIK